VLLVLAVLAVSQALTPSTYFEPADRQRLRAIFAGVNLVGDDIESVYYSILGFNLLEEAAPNGQKACDAVKGAVKDDDVSSLFYASSIAAYLKASKVTCQLSVGNAEKTLQQVIIGDSTCMTLYHAVAALSNLDIQFDEQKVVDALTEAIKADDSALSLGYAFHAASYLKGDLKRFHDLIEDIIAQADEINDKYLQFEGGLHTTAIVIDGAYKLAKAANLAPSFMDIEDKIVKFSNYFLSRKHVQSLRNAASVLSVIKQLATNQFHIPVAVSLASEVSVSNKKPVVQVRVSDLMGGSLGKVTVTADTARHLGDDAIVLSKKQFTPSSADQSLYEFDLLSVKPARGFYRILLSLVPTKPDARLIGTSGAEVEVKVTTQVAVETVEIGVADKEQGSASRTTNLQYPNKAASTLEADSQQRITMTFQLKDKTANEVMVAHQCFIRLTNQNTMQEIFFVPEADASNKYKFDLAVGDKAKDFGHKSGKYSMALIVGDAVIENPLFWIVADVQLFFSDAPSEQGAVNRYSRKPEIKHMFREPDSRPAAFVSSLFTGLVLAPFAVLFIAWLRLGVNVSNFPMSISALGFHVGLAAIFGLYYCYWLNLNMFTTLRYLGFIGIPTFLCGNKLLSSLAAKKKKE